MSKDGTWKVFNTAIEYNKGQVRAYIHSFRLGLVINSFSGCLSYNLGRVCWGQDRERQAESHHDLTRGQAGGPQSGQAGQPVQRADRQTSGEHWGASLSTHCQGLQAAERDDWNTGVNALLIIGTVLFWRPVSLYCGRQAHQNIPQCPRHKEQYSWTEGNAEEKSFKQCSQRKNRRSNSSGRTKSEEHFAKIKSLFIVHAQALKGNKLKIDVINI